jgi:hypothetical protein
MYQKDLLSLELNGLKRRLIALIAFFGFSWYISKLFMYLISLYNFIESTKAQKYGGFYYKLCLLQIHCISLNKLFTDFCV